ncbi:MAG: hypothetical protein LC685_01595 [Actinobacteria bacterium]|nr:hypothetical protein [Actinomycetota bacterium]
MAPTLDLLYVPDCPNLAVARQRVAEAVAAAGVAAEVRERMIADPGDAANAGMNGSPTILVNGRDVAAGDGAASVSCRLYRKASGVDVAPTVDEIIEALGS